MSEQPNTDGREANEAEPLGDFTALGGKGSVKKTGEKSRTSAGPDGPDGAAFGDTFKKPTTPGKLKA
ncbi:hypothetical protein [Caulobacter segnis]|uniref:hypothetical protein n=1 Tax=Caulobacter segnis TaxID=88688 RepID=UPI002863E10E|nr:hypothetical protein [Caulobacter segnis]MDR6624588.1 hypothetical protein [Caulobacter segnis]